MRVDGIDVRDLAPEVLWRRIGLVPQQPYLFTGTVASNLRYGDPDATDEQLWQALEIAQARDFVEAMPQGLETPIAQGGTNVSGGQRQRLCIARALVVKPEIYLFDDSFSALDLATDARLRAALRPHTRDATVVIVAQRVSTITDADQIVVLEGGSIVGVGTHEELLEDVPHLPGDRRVPALARRRRHEHGDTTEATGPRTARRRTTPGPAGPGATPPPAARGARGHGPMASMGMPAEKSMTFGPSARRLIGADAPEAGARRPGAAAGRGQRQPHRRRAQDPGPRHRHHLRRRHRPAAARRAARKAEAVQGARASGNCNFADMLARMDVVPGRGIDFAALGHVLLLVLGLYVARVGLRLGSGLPAQRRRPAHRLPAALRRGGQAQPAAAAVLRPAAAR